VKKGKQGSLYCRCGREKILANGHCATCYTLKRQDQEYFGGLRERVLERDGYACRGCGASGRDKRSIIVHHRVPGKSLLPLMISLVLAVTPKCTVRKRCCPKCRRCCWSFGESSTRKDMNRPHWTTMSEDQRHR